MPEQEERIRELESQFPPLLGSAFATAREQALAAGQSVMEADEGVIYEVLPDGTRKRVKEIERPTPVARGTRIRIR